jgi:SPRY domain
MFDLPETTTVAVGLSTKPYPAFRLPGLNRYSVAYHSNGDKSHNYPFTATPFGPTLKEGDVLGVGYRPRSGTVFFTRNGRKMEDAFISLNQWNLFPTIGADGPCSVHVNLGQSGFVFVEANVKKWGLAPSVGTLAPPPAYGSERGSILLDVGGGVRATVEDGNPRRVRGATSPTPSRRHQRHPRTVNSASAPIASSPLRTSSVVSTPQEPPPPIDEVPDENTAGPSRPRRYISPTDSPFHTPPNTHLPSTPGGEQSEQDDTDGARSFESPRASLSRSSSPEVVAGARNPFIPPRRHPQSSLTHFATSFSEAGSDPTVQVHSPPDSPRTPNPPTPHPRDIHLQALSRSSVDSLRAADDDDMPSNLQTSLSRGQDPPAYSPLDAYTYADGVHIDLPAEFIAAALEGSAPPADAVGQGNVSHSDRRRSRRR